MSIRRVALFLSQRHACGYLPGRIATNAFVDPHQPMSSAVYSRLMARGFRRSGPYVYRPACAGCSACIPARIPVAGFSPRRRQRRIARRNADLRVVPTAPAFREEQFDLYHRYLRARHDDGEMDPEDREAYMQFLCSPWSDTVFLEFRREDRLVAVSVVDHLPDALSAVYTFFDPAEHPRSPGIFAILTQIDWARTQGLPHVYLGYWIAASHKMAYKTDFNPLEIFRDGDWLRADGMKDNNCLTRRDRT